MRVAVRPATFFIAGISTAVAVNSAEAADFVINTDTSLSNADLTISDNDTITISQGVTVGVVGDEAFRTKKNDIVINNAGTLSSTGDEAVRLDDDRNIVNNSSGGVIVSDGDDAIDVRGPDAVINNAGLIQSLSGSNHALRIDDSGVTVTNTGQLIANETGGNALFLRGGATGAVINLNAPGFIGGAISVSTGATGTLNLQSGKSHSVLWNTQFKQADLTDTNDLAGITINRSGPVPWFVDAASGRNATYDPSGLAGAVNGLGDIAALVSQLNRPRQGAAAAAGQASFGYVPNGRGSETATSEYSGGSGDVSNQLWISAFGGMLEHQGDDANLDQTVRQAGIAVGYGWHQSADLQFSAMAGYVRSNIESESRFAKSHDIDSNGFIFGLHGAQQTNAVRIGFGFSGGLLSHDSSRFINDNLATTGGATLGQSSASADYDSWYFSPEIGISTDWEQSNGWTLSPGVRVRYSMQSIDGFTETGSSANATVGDRNLGVFEVNPEIVASRTAEFGVFSVRVGYLARRSAGDDNVSITMLGASNQVGFGDTDSSGFYAGAGLNIKISDNQHLALDGVGYFGDDMTGGQGMAKFVSRF